MEGVPKKFNTPEEEIAFLREEIARKERALLARAPEADSRELETVGKRQLFEYGTFTPNTVLSQEQQLDQTEVAAQAELVAVSHDPVEDILTLALERGIRNALTVLEKSASAFTTDEVHRRLIELIKSGVQVQDLKEGVPPWQLLHMTLYEVVLPESSELAGGREYQLMELFGMMEQFYAGMQSVGVHNKAEHYAIEVANPEGTDHIAFYVSVPSQHIDLFQKQLLSLYPNAVVTEQKHDYNIFVEGGSTALSVAALKKHHIYPIKLPDQFSADPLSVLLNAFSKIERNGGGAALQFIVKTARQKYDHTYSDIVKKVRNGMSPKEAIARSTIGGELYAGFKELVVQKKKKPEDMVEPPDIDQEAIELFQRKQAAPVVEVNIRIAVSAQSAARAAQITDEIEATFNQFADPRSNRFEFKALTGKALSQGVRSFSFRESTPSTVLPLTTTELATVMHLPANGIASSPEFKQAGAKTAAAPSDLPTAGTLLGQNTHRGSTRDIYVTEEDRLRHFYIIGQTGTGKTTLMKNMIVQDIVAGHGVCMIDPHGTDIEDILGAIPPERAGDVIYFDPSRTDRVIGFNMLEYDVTKPEQKTFVVNELFSIFQKLYGKVPESMGPMFEQYFRNATMLVLEDPESGSTLMDISRVLADARFRRQKLEKATNPVVVQFWREIATKAGGEAALENIVPYITSKFDVFTANDFMRPIIGQQHSAFDFRKVMDEQKILLVNLSKGRLGEINANLIGMILVGKILMAALSRVDDPSRSFPDFYLHMDEFQNISTNSISAILSEARKYKLGLTVAHQFIAQLDDEIKDAVFGNVGSIAAFRVGADDATALEHQFSPVFDAHDLMSVPNRNAYARILADGTPTKPFSLATVPPPATDRVRAEAIIEQSYQRYGRLRAEVEAEISSRYQRQQPPADAGLVS